MRVFGIALNSLPEICFAHTYSSGKYDEHFKENKDMLEISYVITGDIHLEYGNIKEVIPQGSLHISRRIEEEHAFCHGLQSHVTVAFKADITDGDILLPNHVVLDGHNYCKDISKIVEEYAAFQKSTLYLQALVLKLVADIAEEWKRSQHNKKYYSGPLYIEKVKRYIVAHLKEKIYVEDIARAVGLSKGYLSEIFHSYTDQTLVEYINRAKLSKIKENMDNYHIPLKEAAVEFGYADICYVSRIYKKYFGQNISGRGLPIINEENTPAH